MVKRTDELNTQTKINKLKIGDCVRFMDFKLKYVGVIVGFDNDKTPIVKCFCNLKSCHSCDGFFNKNIGLYLCPWDFSNIRKISKIELLEYLINGD